MVLFGQSSGPVDHFDPQLLRANGSLFLTRPSLTDYIRDRREFSELTGYLFDAIQADRTPLSIAAELTLEEIDDFHLRMKQRLVAGKGIVRIS